MALIKCSNCSKFVSDKIEKCPHCGHALSTNKTELLRKVSASNISIMTAIYGVLILLCLTTLYVTSYEKLVDEYRWIWDDDYYIFIILFVVTTIFTVLLIKNKTTKLKRLTVICVTFLSLVAFIPNLILFINNATYYAKFDTADSPLKTGKYYLQDRYSNATIHFRDNNIVVKSRDGEVRNYKITKFSEGGDIYIYIPEAKLEYEFLSLNFVRRSTCYYISDYHYVNGKRIYLDYVAPFLCKLGGRNWDIVKIKE